MDADIKTAVCTEGERLLKESHQALSEFNEYLESGSTLETRAGREHSLRDMLTRFGGCYARM